MSSHSISINSSAPDKVIRYAFAAEAGLNIIGGIAMLLYPDQILSKLVEHPSSITTSASCLIQWFGGLSCALAAPLLLGLQNTPRVGESRRVAYWTLLAGEGFL